MGLSLLDAATYEGPGQDSMNTQGLIRACLVISRVQSELQPLFFVQVV